MPKLLPHQDAGARWLAKKKYALLCDEMRVGKTVQAIRACDLVGAKRILVVCPAIARSQWAREFARFQNRARSSRCVIVRSDLTLRKHENVVIVSYALVDSKKLFLANPWGVLILDEGHYLKSGSAKRTKEIYGKGGLVHNAKRVWVLTGTPAPNNASELWPMLYVFGIYKKNYEVFVREFCTGFYSPYGFQIMGSKNVQRLRKLMEHFVLRRRLAEVRPELPPITFSDYAIEGVALTMQEYALLFSESTTPVADRITKQGRELATVLRRYPAETLCQELERHVQSCATLRRYVGLMKVKATVELVKNELDSGVEKIVLFCVHRDVIELLMGELEKLGLDSVHVYGGTSPARREKNLSKFRENKKCRVFIGQIQAAGVAIDLSAASEALFVESSWVPGDNVQAAARLQNIRQTRRVNIRFLGLVGSIDEHVQRVVRRKTRDLALLFD